MNDNQTTVEKIRVYDRDIKSTEVRLKDLKEKLTDEIENTDEGEAVAKLKDQLKLAQEDLMSRLKSSAVISDLLEEIGAENEVLKSQRLHLSDILVAHFAQTQERQVQMDNEGHAKDVLLTAKLSKDDKQYQTSIFADKDGSKL